MRQDDRTDRTIRWMRWAARGIGSLAGAYWILALSLSLTTEANPWAPEGMALAFLVVVAVAGVATAWRREDVGGAITLAGGIALSIFAGLTAGFNRAVAMAMAGGPFLLAAVLFLACRWRSATGESMSRKDNGNS